MGVKANLLRKGNILSAKYFHKMLYHQTTINQTKINELKTIPCYKYEHILILLNWYGHPKNEAKFLKTSPIFLALISLITVHSSYLIIL